ncbi:hypothetical protein AB3X91_09205 [Paraburkholderia sp. BR14263]|uniref:hypothetical protein n=1 Tax=unclassified Paraburkholderia TaxID=2615204 RepID=UPI0034CF7DD4
MIGHGGIMPIMPRKATDAEPDVLLAIAKIDAFRQEQDICILSLARNAGVSQPSLCRFMRNERKSITKTAHAVLRHIDNWHKAHNATGAIMPARDVDHAGLELIESAIRSLWDGDLRTAQILAPLILSLKPTLDLAISITAGDAGVGNI